MTDIFLSINSNFPKITRPSELRERLAKYRTVGFEMTMSIQGEHTHVTFDSNGDSVCDPMAFLPEDHYYLEEEKEDKEQDDCDIDCNEAGIDGFLGYLAEVKEHLAEPLVILMLLTGEGTVGCACAYCVIPGVDKIIITPISSYC